MIQIATRLYQFVLKTKSFRLINWYSLILARHGYTATYQLGRGWILYPLPQFDAEKQAERFIRAHTALYRHYCLPEVQRAVEQFTGITLTRDETKTIVQRIRDEKALGPIADYNL